MSDVKSEIDSFLNNDKMLTGDIDWRPTHVTGEWLCRRPLLSMGEYLDSDMVVKTYPNTKRREFRILLTYRNHCVSRLDYIYERDGAHINDFNAPPEYPTLPIREPHFHDWNANRIKVRNNLLPQSLPYANLVGSQVENIKQGFWWFCDQVNITAISADTPDWPAYDNLL